PASLVRLFLDGARRAGHAVLSVVRGAATGLALAVFAVGRAWRGIALTLASLALVAGLFAAAPARRSGAASRPAGVIAQAPPSPSRTRSSTEFPSRPPPEPAKQPPRPHRKRAVSPAPRKHETMTAMSERRNQQPTGRRQPAPVPASRPFFSR